MIFFENITFGTNLELSAPILNWSSILVCIYVQMFILVIEESQYMPQ